MTPHRIRIARLLTVASIVVGCNDTTAPVRHAVSSIIVSPDSVSIHIGHSLQMRATLLDSARDTLSSQTVWSSSDTGVATVTSLGLVTGRNYGQVIISARADSASGSATIIVLMPVASVYTAPDTATLVPGGQFQLTPIVQGPGGAPLSDRIITWASSSPSVATVSANGMVTAVAAGPVVIMDSSEGVASQGTRVLVAQPQFVILASGNSANGTCGITTTGSLFCWGDNSLGELGNGTYTNRNSLNGPVPWPTGIVNIGSINNAAMADYVTCAISMQYGPPEALCWGSGDHGRLGNNSVDGSAIPGFVQTSVSFWQVSASTSHTCALAGDSSAYCWGRGGVFPTPVPVPVMSGLRFRSIGAGYDHTCGISTDSLAHCWGVNSDGVLGNDTASASATVAGGHRFMALATGDVHVCGIASDSTAYCWGQGKWGQLGTGDTVDAHVPVAVVGGHKFIAIAAGTYHTCALTAQGAAFCWGSDAGLPSSAVPIAVPGGLAFTQIVAGQTHSCALTTAGVAYCWGGNSWGQLGDGTTTDRTVPVRVIGQP